MTARAAGVLLALVVAVQGHAGPATEAIMNAPDVAAQCAYLTRECRLGKAARDAHPGWVEHPSGVVVGTTSPEATLHVGNAVEAAAAMRLLHDEVPACVAECDALLHAK